MKAKITDLDEIVKIVPDRAFEFDEEIDKPEIKAALLSVLFGSRKDLILQTCWALHEERREYTVEEVGRVFREALKRINEPSPRGWDHV